MASLTNKKRVDLPVSVVTNAMCPLPKRIPLSVFLCRQGECVLFFMLEIKEVPQKPQNRWCLRHHSGQRSAICEGGVRVWKHFEEAVKSDDDTIKNTQKGEWKMWEGNRIGNNDGAREAERRGGGCQGNGGAWEGNNKKPFHFLFSFFSTTKKQFRESNASWPSLSLSGARKTRKITPSGRKDKETKDMCLSSSSKNQNEQQKEEKWEKEKIR